MLFIEYKIRKMSTNRNLFYKIPIDNINAIVLYTNLLSKLEDLYSSSKISSQDSRTSINKYRYCW